MKPHFLERNKRLITIVFWVALILISALLGAGVSMLNLSKGAAAAVILIWSCIVGAGIIAIFTWWYRRLNRQVAALIPILMEEQEKAFSKLRENPKLGAILAILSIFQNFALGRVSEAKSLLEKERPRWENNYIRPDFKYLDDLCRNS